MTSPADPRFFRIAGIVLAVASDDSRQGLRWHDKFKAFETDGPGPDTVWIRHHSAAWPEPPTDPGRRIYAHPPYEIFAAGGDWIYRIGRDGSGPLQTAVFSGDYGRADIYTPGPIAVPETGFASLTLLPTDQILLAPLLAARDGCLLHAAGVIDGGRGWLFAGHSTAGKSSITTLLKGRAEILCDDRIALRPGGDRFRIHGTWSHGDVPDVSPGSAPLQALFLLRKSAQNSALPILDRRTVVRHLIDLVIKPLPTADWWSRTLGVVERLAAAVPVYELSFDLSGRVLEVLDAVAAGGEGIDFKPGSR
ncbi:MAG: hypothetical protein PHI34_10065 [Acidobacteriota bacterium]|nr:hypothetical protein [Acidobacteriota bacterium]